MWSQMLLRKQWVRGNDEFSISAAIIFRSNGSHVAISQHLLSFFYLCLSHVCSLCSFDVMNSNNLLYNYWCRKIWQLPLRRLGYLRLGREYCTMFILIFSLQIDICHFSRISVAPVACYKGKLHSRWWYSRVFSITLVPSNKVTTQLRRDEHFQIGLWHRQKTSENRNELTYSS